ncbi:MAG: hypothetical protein HFF17_14010 [Oscillospiraceae bacterium]|nr:hypothetical protein [Oscillospiraceae bacterium]
MKKVIEQYPAEVYISPIDLEHANLNEWENLELHLLNQAAVVIPGQMTAMELIHTAEALQGLAADLFIELGRACELCDGCQIGMSCDLMKGEIRPEVNIPDYVLEKANYDPDYKLTFVVNDEDGKVQITEADHRFDLTDLSPDLVHTLRECKVCLADLEEKLMREEIVYGMIAAEDGRTDTASEE